jgi:hypothetical protein
MKVSNLRQIFHGLLFSEIIRWTKMEIWKPISSSKREKSSFTGVK